MDFRALIVTDDEPFNYRELEEALMAIDFEVEFTSELSSDLSWISNAEFRYDVFFLLKEPLDKEIPAVSSLSKMKVMFVKPEAGSLHSKSRKSSHWLNSKGVYLDDILNVVDDSSEMIVLSASSMMSNPRYFEKVEKITAIKAYHIFSKDWETVLHGGKTTKALVGELITRAGREVHLGIRKDNLMVFSCDVFSNFVMSKGDNARFIQNAVEVMLEGADFVD